MAIYGRMIGPHGGPGRALDHRRALVDHRRRGRRAPARSRPRAPLERGGFRAARAECRAQRDVRGACMLAACVASALFLVSYVVYHALAGSRPFGGQGWIRVVYVPILVSHVVLAAAMVPFVLTTVYRALSGQFDRHVPIARRTLPVWLYVSVTGVLVYLLLYHLG